MPEIATRPTRETTDEPSRHASPVLHGIRGNSILGQVFWLSTPVLIEQTLVYLVGLSDTILTGRYLSVEHLAAVTTSAYLLWFVSGLLMVASAGSAALIARFAGAGEHALARRICGQAQFLALTLGAAIGVAAWFGADPFLRLLNLQGLAAEQGALYLRLILLVGPLLAARVVGIACLRGAGDTRTGMWIMGVVNLLNIGLSWAMVIGLGPFPALGLKGIALGTTASEAVGGLLVLLVLARGRAGLALHLHDLRPHLADLQRILRISLPAAGESLTNSLCQLWFLGLINRLGSEATAAHGVALRCEALAFLSLLAFAVSGGTLAGQYLGAGRADLAAHAARVAWLWGVLVSMLLGFLLYTQAWPMMRLFLRDANTDVAVQGIRVLRLVAFALPALATIQVLSGVLRGVGDTRWPWLVVLAGYFLVRMPLTYLFARPESDGALAFGLYGAWMAMFADLHARGGLIALRFLHGGWKHVRV